MSNNALNNLQLMRIQLSSHLSTATHQQDNPPWGYSKLLDSVVTRYSKLIKVREAANFGLILEGEAVKNT